MAYVKQNWNAYDEALSLEENMNRYAVMTPAYLNHMEDGIAEVDAKSFDTIEVTTVGANVEAEAEVVDGILHMTIPAGPAGREGDKGADGKSAYQTAVDNGFEGTEEEWLATMKGESGQDGAAGADGADGKSAYELAVEGGFTGTKEEWLASLKGAAGEKGEPGKSGVGIGVSANDPVMVDADDQNIGMIDVADITPALNIGDHFIAPSGEVFQITAESEDVYTVSKTSVNLSPVDGTNGTDGTNGHSVGVAMMNPSNNEIAIAQIDGVTQIGDHFITPSGDVYKITGTKEGDDNTYTIEGTGVTMNGGAIGHCSGLALSTSTDAMKTPPINITYTDPENEGVPYGGTVVTIKEGSAPTGPDDGDIIENTMDKDKYKTSPLVITPARTGGSTAHTKTFYATLFPYSASGVYNLLKKESKSIELSYAEYMARHFAKGTTFQTVIGMSYLKCVDTCIFDNKCLAVFNNSSQNIFELTEEGISTPAAYTIPELTDEQLLTIIGKTDTDATLDKVNFVVKPVKICAVNGKLYITVKYTIPFTSNGETLYGKGYAVYYYDIDNNSLSLLHNNHNDYATDDDDVATVYTVSAIGDNKLFIAASLKIDSVYFPKYAIVDIATNNTTSLDLAYAGEGTTDALRVSAYTIENEWYIHIKGNEGNIAIYTLTTAEDGTISATAADNTGADNIVEVLNVGNEMIPVSFDSNWSLQILSDYKTFDEGSEATKTEMGVTSTISTLFPYVGDSFLLYEPNTANLTIINIVTE